MLLALQVFTDFFQEQASVLAEWAGCSAAVAAAARPHLTVTLLTLSVQWDAVVHGYLTYHAQMKVNHLFFFCSKSEQSTVAKSPWLLWLLWPNIKFLLHTIVKHDLEDFSCIKLKPLLRPIYNLLKRIYMQDQYVLLTHESSLRPPIYNL